MKNISRWVQTDLPPETKFRFDLLDKIKVQSLTDFKYHQSWVNTDESGQLNDLLIVDMDKDGDFHIQSVTSCLKNSCGSNTSIYFDKSNDVLFGLKLTFDYPSTLEDFAKLLDIYFFNIDDIIDNIKINDGDFFAYDETLPF